MFASQHVHLERLSDSSTRLECESRSWTLPPPVTHHHQQVSSMVCSQARECSSERTGQICADPMFLQGKTDSAHTPGNV